MDSPLLCKREDGSQDFIHDTYRDFFLAIGMIDEEKAGHITHQDIQQLFTRIMPGVGLVPEEQYTIALQFYLGNLEETELRRFAIKADKIKTKGETLNYATFIGQLSDKDLRIFTSIMSEHLFGVDMSLRRFLDYLIDEKAWTRVKQLPQPTLSLFTEQPVQEYIMKYNAYQEYLAQEADIGAIVSNAEKGDPGAIFATVILDGYHDFMTRHVDPRNKDWITTYASLEALERSGHYDCRILDMIDYLDIQNPEPKPYYDMGKWEYHGTRDTVLKAVHVAKILGHPEDMKIRIENLKEVSRKKIFHDDDWMIEFDRL